MIKEYFQKVFYLLDDDKKKIPILTLLFILLSLFDVFGISVVASFISFISNDTAVDNLMIQIFEVIGWSIEKDRLLLNMGFLIIAIFLAKTFFAISLNKIIIKFSQNQKIKLSSFLMNAYQSLPYVQYLNRNSSEYIHSIRTLTETFSALILLLLRTFSDLIVAFFIVLLLAWHNVYLLIFLVIITGLVVWVYDSVLNRGLDKFGKKANEANNLVIRGVIEGISGLKEIRVLGKEKYFYNNVFKGIHDSAYYDSKVKIAAFIPRYLIEFVMVFFVTSTVIIIILFGNGLDALFTTLAIFGIASLRLLPVVSGLSNTLIFLRVSSDSLKKLFNDVQESKKSKITRVVDGYQLSSEKFREFELENVSFSYPDKASDVLKNISMKVVAGEAIGIIGPSGAGKTTLIDLILCLLDPSGGSIKYNGNESKLSLLEWRSQIAYLPQQIFIIDDTLKANIALGVDNVDDTQLNYAIKKAKLVSLVNSLSDGVESFIGEKGIRLSGGERQRVALARAFYHDKNILVMDESTSSLDLETEKEIIKEIKNLRGTKTLIVIAHRMSTIQHCNRIYHIENGRVLKSGKFEKIVS
jgi:ATP-binding cassette, subfamily B, bacterial PglK